MITSNRKFGIEIEFVAPNEQALRAIQNNLNIVHDGSLRPLQYAAEYVSPPIAGKVGVETVHNACEVLKKAGAKSEDIKTSVHVHLDGKVGDGQLRSARTKPDVKGRVIAVSNRIKEGLTPADIMMMAMGRAPNVANFFDFYRKDFDGVIYYSKAELRDRPRINYTYYWLEKPDRFHWLRNMFYFYTKFSSVMESIVSDSRKFGNMYCIPLGFSYDLDVIAGAQDIEQLKNVWYKGRAPMQHYDDSRYHNVNLHSFWDRHGTVEIRSHGGTLDANKILLWVKLHQAIADKLEDMPFEDLVDMGSSPSDFINFLDSSLLQDYVKRLLGFYSGIKVK